MRPEKRLLVEDMKERLDKAKGFFFTRYKAMNPNLAAQFRFSLHGLEGDFEVIKKRILMKAVTLGGHSMECSLDGHIGVVFANGDPLPIAKSIFSFKEKHEEVLDVLGGHFDGQMYSAKEVELFAKLPTKREMRAEMLHLFEAVPSQLLAVMEALLASVGYCLGNKNKT